MKKNLLLSLALFTGCAAFAQTEAPVLQSTVPADGQIVSSIGAISLTYSQVPTPNKDCTIPATLTRDDEVIATTMPISNFVVQGEEGAALENISVSFATQPILSAGEYTFYIPEGFFTFDDGNVLSEPVVVKCSVLKKVAPEVSPAPGYFTELPNVYTISFPGAKSITINELQATADGEQAVYFCTPVEQEQPEMIVLKDKVIVNTSSNGNFTRRGTYSLDIPEGAFTVEFADGSSMINSTSNNIYYIPVIPYPNMDPAPGKVTELKTFKMYFTEEQECTFDRMYLSPVVIPIDKEGNLLTSNKIACPMITPSTAVRGATELEFRLGNAITTPGKYAFKEGRSGFSATGYLDDDNPDTKGAAWANCDYFWYYEVVESLAKIESVYDAATPKFHDVASLQINMPNAEANQINIVNPNAATIRDIFDDVLPYTVTLSVEDVMALSDDNQEGTRINIDIEPTIEKAGDYTLLIPAGTIEVANNKSPLYFMEFTVDPTVTGVDAIYTPDSRVNVYGIDGRIVALNFRYGDLNNLPAGIYIVNNKKIVVRN